MKKLLIGFAEGLVLGIAFMLFANNEDGIAILFLFIFLCLYLILPTK